MNHLFKWVFNFTFNGLIHIFPALAPAFCRVLTEIGAQKPAIIDILVSFSKITISRKSDPRILFKILEFA